MRLLLAIMVLMNSCLTLANSDGSGEATSAFGQGWWLLIVIALVVTSFIGLAAYVFSLRKTILKLQHKNTELDGLLSAIPKAVDDVQPVNISGQSEGQAGSKQDKRDNETKANNYEKLATLGSITAGVAHEVNNPNNFVNLSADMLGKELLTVQQYLLELAGEDADPEIINSFKQKFEPLFAYLDTIKDGSERIKIIVEGLRDYTQQSDGKPKMVNITELINSTVRLVQSQYKKTIEFKLRFKHSPTVQCYPAKLNQIFMNLVVNACHAIEHNCERCNVNCGDGYIGSITIGCEQIDWTADDKNLPMVEITVADTGCGMTEETKAKLFEPFYTTKSSDKGTGLGLSISADLVAEHHGQLLVESKLNQGTTFILRIPMNFQ